MAVSVSANIIANVAARVWIGGLQLIFVPVYLRLLGSESYGLVGFYVTLVTATIFLDSGISPVLMREFARLRHKADSASEMRRLLFNLECLSLGTALAIGAALVLLARTIALHWLGTVSLSTSDTSRAVALMGLSLACQWPGMLYASGLIGLQRQDWLMRLRIVGGTVQWAGGAAILWLVAPRVDLLLLWQAGALALLSALSRWALWRQLPLSPERLRFDLSRLHGLWRYGAGMLSIGVTYSIMMQADKLVVSSFLPLDRFAAYSLTFTAASLIPVFVAQPVGFAVMPHLVRLYLDGDERGLAREYHRWTQVTAVLSLPAAGVLCAFARPLVEIWLGKTSPMVDEVTELLPWAAMGNLLYTLYIIPTRLQAAAAWTRLSFLINAVVIAVGLPALLIGVPRVGPVAGVGYWLGLNAGTLLIGTIFMHRRLLQSELVRWWSFDVLLPSAIAALLLFLSTRLSPPGQGYWDGVLQAAATAAAVSTALAAVLPYPRQMLTILFWRTLRAFG
ncbi:MAG TPA: oligosaccharide flippase family protein [Stellaceae bacterium]|nr:oligosaccharide flippase family protein [Stellaceae bacterium]